MIQLLNPVELEQTHDSREISAMVEIVKPVNKNVWEYDPDFLTNNDLSVPENEQETAALLELWERQHGPNA